MDVLGTPQGTVDTVSPPVSASIKLTGLPQILIDGRPRNMPPITVTKAPIAAMVEIASAVDLPDCPAYEET